MRGEREFRLWNIYINALAGGKKSSFRSVEEKGVGKRFKSLGKQGLTEGNVIFGGAAGKGSSELHSAVSNKRENSFKGVISRS